MPSSATDQLAGAVHAIRCGDHAALARLLAADPALARRRVWTGREARTLLHVATDSPGHLPGVATTLRLLVHAGADVNAPFEGPHAERPLHWAASNDDVEALDALLDLGADIEAPGSVLGGGPPLVDAVGFGQWNAARRLVARGARVTLDQSAALGLVDRLTERLAALGAAPAADALSRALWFACHGCQQDAADLLVARGADVNWLPPWERLTPLDAAVRSGATTLAESLRQHGARSAHATNPGSST
ncbi:MAG: ankyrin repeat domain-containing protein [Gemmatimonadetes bacterium]|nr:ankyrin repeat domain-containing protein [Gemmatimonadota bacterium]